MKLLLTSDGLTSSKIRKEFLKLLDKPVSENRVLIMHTASKPKHFKWVKGFKTDFVKLGIKKANVQDVNITKNVFANKYKNYDILLASGGNTFYILDRVKKTGFDKWIKDFVKKNNLYIGISAGSIIVHKTIEIAGWGSEGDRNLIGLGDLRGLNLTNIAMFPHHKNRLEKELRLFRKNSVHPIVELKDKQAFTINGKIKKKIK